MSRLPKFFKISNEVLAAQRGGKAVVALESTVITHGLPRPANIELAKDLEALVRKEGATPATIGALEGRIHVGLDSDEIEKLAADETAVKLSARDIAAAISGGNNGGTTVAATLRVAAQASIDVFATGGIGGVHRGSHWDVSADLSELAKQPVIVVCAGAKSILDLPATLEQLETLSVPVIGYKTDKFPAFYSASSGLALNSTVSNLQEIALLAQAHWQLGGAGILLVQPLPKEESIPNKDVEAWITQALEETKENGIDGQAVSPYLLKRVNELSKGKALKANLALLKNNAKLAAQIAQEMNPKVKHAGLLPRST
jgi:pseudouridine-5'-phosphate glycosidase